MVKYNDMDVNLKKKAFRPNVFRPYDIRGLWPEELDHNSIELIAAAFVDYLHRHDKGERILVGRDLRSSSDEIAEVVINELRNLGADVIDAGEVTTPLFTFAANLSEADGGLMVTASHDSIRYNGFKIYEEGRALSESTGLEEIKNIIESGNIVFKSEMRRGALEKKDFREDYAKFIISKINIPRPLKAVFDAGGGAVGVVLPVVLRNLKIWHYELGFLPDPALALRAPNPLMLSAQLDARKEILKNHADAGFIFDPDGDRVLVLDENGDAVRPDAILWLFASNFGRFGDAIVSDIRSSEFLFEDIENRGLRAIPSRVGHSFIKETMRENNAVFAGELSGHFYFRDFFYSESAIFAALTVLELIALKNKTLSELVRPFFQYFHSGEVNFISNLKEYTLSAVEEKYKDGSKNYLDGITIRYPNWWFNLRPSGTEDLLRLVMEAKSKSLFDEKREEIIGFLVSKGARLA